MSGLRSALRLSFVTGETELPIPPASEILARLRSGPVWDGASIAPADDQFPLLHIEWHEAHGFVIQCYEDERAWSDFLVADPRCGAPMIEVNLGGQTLERWPSALFVPEELARQALVYFLATGDQDAALHWVRIDAFPRETIWVDREGREAWERAESSTKAPNTNGAGAVLNSGAAGTDVVPGSNSFRNELPMPRSRLSGTTTRLLIQQSRGNE